MVFVGIDQSLRSTGIVVMNEDGVIIDICLIKTDKSLSDEECIKVMRDDLSTFISNLDEEVDSIFLEGLAYGRSYSKSFSELCGVYYTILLFILDNKYNYDVFPPTKVKSFAGSGNYTKIQMLNSISKEDQKILKEYEHRKTEGLYDIVDAYHICKLGLKER